MRVTVYLKSDKEPLPTLTYEFDLQEFQRLARDFENFLKSGQPQGGLYKQNVPDESETQKEKSVFLDFTIISVLA
jgi:hypothetical protein